MNITITSNTTLQEVKTTFHHSFPGLKIEFFVDLNNDGNYTANEQIKDYSATLESIGAGKSMGQVSIEDNSTVAEVENSFKELFGVIAQIFRKSGNTWLMTSSTDNMSLAQINKMAIDSETPPDSDSPINSADRMELE